MTLTYALIIIFLFILGLVVFNILSPSSSAKRIDEIKQMIDEGKTEAAIKRLNLIVAKDDKYAYAHYLLGKAYQKEKNIAYAVLEYKKVVKLGHFDEQMKETDVHRELAKLYSEQKKTEDARQEYIILTKIEPKNFENYFEIGKLYMHAGQQKKAVEYFKRTVILNHNHVESCLFLGQLYYNAASYGAAKDILSAAVNIAPNNYNAHYFLGLSLRQLRQYDEAIKEFEAAQKDDGLKVKCFFSKASCLIEKGQFFLAITELQRGIKMAPVGSEAALSLMYLLAAVYEKMRNIQAAVVIWKKIETYNSDYKDVAAKLQKFSDFVVDDLIKDFLIANNANFEIICKRIVEAMGYTVLRCEVVDDANVEIQATEADVKWRGSRHTNRLIRIIRSTDIVPEDIVPDLYDKARSGNAGRVAVITAGEYSNKTRAYAQTRPVELLHKSDLSELLRKVQSAAK